jgi:hypothetical protein
VDEVPAFAEPTGTLTLKDALSAALMNNPRLAAFSWNVRVKDAEALQASCDLTLSLRQSLRTLLEAENLVG